MERRPRRGDRNGSAGPGHSHADQGLPPRLRGVCGEAQAGLRRRLMDRFAHLDWPFFEDQHRKLARAADAWAAANLGHSHGEDADAICRRLVQDLGCAGYLRHSATEKPDVRSIALLREVFAYHSGLADFSFVMQGLGSGPIALAGSASQKDYLRKAASGDAIAAFAL